MGTHSAQQRRRGKASSSGILNTSCAVHADHNHIPVVSLDDILKALSFHEIHGGLHAIQQGQDRCVGHLPILVGLDHVLQVIVYTLQLGSLASL